MLIKICTLIAIIIICGLVLVIDRNQSPNNIYKELQDVDTINNPSPEFTVQLLDDGKISLKDITSPVVLVSFWASWCAICAKEFPDMMELVRRSQGKITLLAISIDDDTNKALKFRDKLFKQHKGLKIINNIYWAIDIDKEISLKTFNIIKTPETIILDKNRNMIKKIVGITKWNEGQTKELIRPLL